MRIFAKDANDFYYCRKGIAYHYILGYTYSFECSEEFLSALSRLLGKKLLHQIDTLRDTNVHREVALYFDTPTTM